MTKEKVEKRLGGQIVKNKAGGDIWLVCSESTPIMEGDQLIGYKHSCGEQLLGFIDYRPIWDGPFPMSGGGEVRREHTPYCPKCEDKPHSLGPIDIGGKIWGTR